LNDENYLKNEEEVDDEGEKAGKSLFKFIKKMKKF
jgi:hypothetical protein